MTETSFVNKIYAENPEEQDANEIDLYGKQQDEKCNQKISYSDAKHEITELIMRVTSFDSLVYDWLEEQMLSKEVLVYLLENLIPILISGLQKLLIEAGKFGFKENVEFNPINFLAQYLMRNKTCLKKKETFAYAKSIQKILTKLKDKNVHEYTSLNKFETENEKDYTNSMEDIFIQWAGQRDAVIRLSLVKSLQRTFLEHCLLNNKDYLLNLKDCASSNTDERLLNIKEFVQYLNDQWSEMDKEVFNEFKSYSLSCSLSYSTFMSYEDIRNSLNDLFTFCDRGQKKSLNRMKILNLLASFYDQSEASVNQSLRNPRIWPIIEFEEEDNNEISEYLNKKIGKTGAIIDMKHGKWDVGIFNKFELNKDQFVNMLMLFLEDSSRFTLESLIKFIQAEYINLNEEAETMQIKENELKEIKEQKIETTQVKKVTKTKDIENAQKGKNIEKRYMLLNYLFDLWDRDSSGFLEINEIESVLTNWRKDELHDYLYSQTLGAFNNIHWRISRSQFKRIIDDICALFPKKDVFDQLIKYLIKSVQRLSEEDNNDDSTTKILQSIASSWKTSGMLIDPIFQQTIQVIQQYAQNYGKIKISVYVALLEGHDKMFEKINSLQTLNKKFVTEENNAAEKSVDVAPNVLAGISTESNKNKYLRYVATSVNDRDILLNKLLHRDLKCVSFIAVDSGIPVYIQEVLHHGGVFLWNPIRALEKIEGSFICFPLKDEEQKVIGILGIDTMAEPNETKFFPQEISFYQVVAKTLSQTYQQLCMVQKTIQVAENAIYWIFKSCACVNEVIIYHVEPDLEPIKSNVLHKLMIYNQNNCFKTYNSQRIKRSSNILKNYLFECIDISMTVITKDLKENHYAFPIRDIYGAVVLILDISICSSKFTMQQKMEIQNLLKLLDMAQKEINKVETNNFSNYLIFDGIILRNAINNILKFSDRLLEELLSYQEPPKIVHSILKAVCCVYVEDKGETNEMEKLDQWENCRDYLSPNLVEWIISFDPVTQINKQNEKKFAMHLKALRAEDYLMAPIISSRYLITWAFVCFNLIEKIKIETLQHKNYVSKEIIKKSASEEVIKNGTSNEIIKNGALEDIIRNGASEEIIKNYASEETINNLALIVSQHGSKVELI